MNKRFTFFILTIFILTLFSGNFATLRAEQNCAEIKLIKTDGTETTLSTFEAENYVVIFWASWCGWCRKEIPTLKKIHQNYDEKKVKIIAVSQDQDKEKLLTFIKKQEIPYSVYYRNDEFADCLGEFRGIPTTFILDKNFKVIQKFVGYRPYEKFEEILNK